MPQEDARPGRDRDARRQRRFDANTGAHANVTVDVKCGGNSMGPPAHAVDTEAVESAGRCEPCTVIDNQQTNFVVGPGNANDQL